MGARLEEAVRRFAGSDEGLHTVRWTVGGRRLECVVPGDDRWICIKDDLLLREYEWMGIDLDRPRDLVVDGGAHVGTFTAMAALHAAKVVAVEPTPTTAALLRDNMARNGLDHVQVVEGALWPTAGTVDLHDNTLSSASSVIGGEATGVSVPTVTLGQLVEDHGTIDLLKLDIEGAEFPLLRETPDEVLARVDTIVGEMHLWASDDPDESALVRRLEAAGFTVEVRNLPIHHVRESLGRLRTNARDLEGHLRLKATVAGVYAMTAVLDPLIGLRDRLHAHDLRLFTAHR
jgi:FkbM family methyltransferase